MKSELDSEGLPKQIPIEPTPPSIQLEGLEFEPVDFEKVKSEPQGKCLANANYVSKKNLDVEIIEGVVIYVNKQNEQTVFVHAWNRHGDSHFDLTNEKTWKSLPDFKNIKELRYAPVVSYFASEIKESKEVSFSNETTDVAKKLLDTLKGRRK